MPEFETLTQPDEFIRSIEPVTIRAIGPEYSFSDVLARTLFDPPDGSHPMSRRPNLRYHENFSDVARAVRHDSLAVGVLPVENSATNPVQAVTDELLTGDFIVVGEATLMIHLVLAGPAGKKLRIEDVKTVLSQAKPFGQARRFLETHNFEPAEVDSTAKAARLVAEMQDPRVAALCGIRAARRFGLQEIEGGVQDNPDNKTRFLLVKSADGNVRPDIETAQRGLWRNVKKTKVAGIVTPELMATRGLTSVLSHALMRDLEVEVLGHTNQSALPNRDRDYFMEFIGHHGALWNALRDERNYRSDMNFKMVGVYPVGSVYTEGAK